MLQLIGIKSNCAVDVREKLSIIPKHSEKARTELLKVCEETVILSTCNRTELYINSKEVREDICEQVFESLGWDKRFLEYTFLKSGEEVVKHLMELSCGFYSKILGEDQILAQIKNAWEEAVCQKTALGELQRLFQQAVACGKEFRDKSELYRIPVSSSSIAVKEAGVKGAKSFMVLGYGEVGQLTCKYILGSSFENLYIVVRNTVGVEIEDSRVKIIPFENRKEYYKLTDCIISCTSAPHTVVHKKDLPNKKMIIFDLAVPRDVEKEVSSIDGIELYDIDEISAIDDENKKIRQCKMEEFKFIVEKHFELFNQWQYLRKIAPEIKKLKIIGEKVYVNRCNTFANKKNTKDNEVLARTLLKSISDAYINRAIEVLKDEQMKGKGEECLRIIEKIFCQQLI